MDQNLLKAGFKKLYVAEILSIFAAFANSFGSSTFAIILSVVLIICSIVSYFMNLKGMKICSQADQRFAQAYKLAIIGLICSVIIAVVEGFVKEGTVQSICSIVDNTIELAITYVFLTAAVAVFAESNKTLSTAATKAKEWMMYGWILFEVLNIISVILPKENNTNVILPFIAIVVGLLAIVALIVAEINVFKFYKKAYQAL